MQTVFELLEVNSFLSTFWQVQIQGEQGQVLQVASPTQQQLQGITTTQLVQQGELTEEQHQQVTDMHEAVYMTVDAY